MLPALDGSRACYQRLKQPRPIVRTLFLVLYRFQWWSDPLTSANFLRMSVYLTSKLDESTLWNIAVNDPGADFDPMTLLRSRTLYGRPDWKSIYSHLRTVIELGQYLPGRESSLKTSVGVGDYIHS
jgi:hypothetical protein